MNILVEARSLTGSMGVKTYIVELLRALIRQQSHRYTVIYDRQQHRGMFPGAQEIVVPLRSKILLAWWLQRQLPQLIKARRPDLVHFTKADVPAHKTLPTVTTIHDVIPLLLPASQKMMQRLYWPGALQRSASQSDHILTVSEASKADIVQHLQVAPESVTVTPLAANTDHFKPADAHAIAAVLHKHKINQPYILFVGTWEPRKNIASLICAWAAASTTIPHQLVLAGKKGYRSHETLELISTLPARERVRVLEHVAYEELPTLYSGADAFVWPSIYEGWGLPVLEAMACGTPVVVSDGGSLPQVVGEAGVVVPFTAQPVPQRLHDSQFEEQLRRALIALVSDSAKKQQYRQAGLIQSQRFTWEAVAKTTTRVYEQVVTSL